MIYGEDYESSFVQVSLLNNKYKYVIQPVSYSRQLYL
jgi:hypothetical protein